MTLAFNAVLAALAFVTGMLSARILGPGGRGELSAIQTWPNFIATIALLGVPDALVFFVARDRKNASRHFASALALTLLCSVPAMMIGYLALPHLLAAQSIAVVRAARIYLFAIPLLALCGLPMQAIRGFSWNIAWNFLRLVLPMGWLAILVLSMLSHQASAPKLAGEYLVAQVLFCMPVICVVLCMLAGNFSVGWSALSKLLRFGAPTVIGSTSQALNLRLDQMMMAGFLAPRQLGLYVAAATWSGVTAVLMSALSNVILPRLAGTHSSIQQRESFARCSRFAVLLSLSSSTAMLVMTPFAFSFVFGQAYRPALICAMVLVVAAAFGGFNIVMEDAFRGLGHPRVPMQSEAVGLVVTAVLLLVLLKPMGALGAAVASLFSYATVSLLLIVNGLKINVAQFVDMLMPRSSEIASDMRHLRSLWPGKSAHNIETVYPSISVQG